MELSNNNSYNNIVEYIRSNENLSDNEKRYLIHYATSLQVSDVENVSTESISDMIKSVKEYTQHIKSSANTTIVYARIEKILSIIDMISDYFNGAISLFDIGYNLDKLFLDSDMGIRDTSSLSYSLKNKKKVGHSDYESTNNN